MSEERPGYSINKAERVQRFGSRWLSRLLILFEELLAEGGYGRLEIVIQDGRIVRINKTVSYRE